MTPERWRRVQEIFAAAAERTADTRASYLDSACRGDAELRKEVESLLASHDAASSGFLDSPAMDATEAMTTPPIGRRSLPPGVRLGVFEILSPIGAGGMGEVYRARDSKLQRDVAIKVLSPSLAGDAELLARFEREALAVAALSHPNILSIYNFESDKGVAYAVMELLEGQTLRARLKAGPIAEAQILDFALQITRGLAAAHEKEIVHRDLKPENIFITKDGRIKILDFGLAKKVPTIAAGEETSAPTMTGHTTPGMVMGTLGYMSPEQLLGLSIDHRTDLFSLGVVLYEMTTRQMPFKGNSAVAIADAILHAEPRDFGDQPVPGRLKLLIRRLLEKEAAKRYSSAEAVLAELKALEASLAPAPSTRLSRGARVGLAIAAGAAMALVAWFWYRSSQERWARETATPEIARLIEARDQGAAAALARRARAILPGDPAIEKLWLKATGEANISSVPPGAEVSFRPFDRRDGDWRSLGRTPFKNVRIPDINFIFRVGAPGFDSVTFIDGPVVEWEVTLPRKGTTPADMVPVSSRDSDLWWPHNEAPTVHVEGFFIDRHEVTNDEFKKFMDAGGYEKREYWKQRFVRDGREIPWDEAISSFRDSTGRTGPATWEAGGFPKGKEKHPVSGVSWYEAAAYAEFVGKSLPTAYHWSLAAQRDWGHVISKGGNFRGSGTQPVESPGTLSGWGTSDMAGNVKEWCWNESWHGERFILGGGFGEPEYMFMNTDSHSPWARGANFGFRCVKLSAPASPEATAKREPRYRDYDKETPVPDEVFQAFKGLYRYDQSELNARVEETRTDTDWIEQKVSFDAAYGKERVTARLYLPKHLSPPFQTVIYFPGGNPLYTDTYDPSIFEDVWAFLPEAGRVVVYPIYKDMFERGGGRQADIKPGARRDRVIMWSKDLGRTLDYLATRKDIDSSRVAYLGLSMGAAYAPIMLTNEPRFKTAILSAGGFFFRDALPEADPFNFITRVKIPILMLNGRWDGTFPVELSQLPFFRHLGTPPAGKKHLVYDSYHGDLPHKEEVRETLDWLDKYLGPVKR